ncbi:MAG TPA: AAA family ATPase [Deltaproteobacteria bacterium]|nr:AAA family ATPase [Deltaproteobacteria bacterium]
MFEKYFSLSENPFNLTPDPKFLFMARQHQEAQSFLEYGIQQRKGFVLITGEVGTGKTTLCRSLMASLSPKVRSALVLNPSLSDIELLQTINQDFGINGTHTSKKTLLDTLYDFLIETFVRGENAVLIIDECQNLSPQVLEQIRMLSNLETEKEKLLQIVLVGQPELGTMLSCESMKQINDRIVLRYHLWPLSRRDTREYLSHRLVVAGAKGDVQFTPWAVRCIYAYSRGVPRKINAVAERAMLVSYLNSRKQITRASVRTAVRELQGNYEYANNKPGFLFPVISGMVAVVIIGIMWPSFFTDLSDILKPAVVATETTFIGEVMPPLEETSGEGAVQSIQTQTPSAWAIPHYKDALEILAQIPDGLNGPDILNLHPMPDHLKEIPYPSIVSVHGGYFVLVQAGDEYVRVVGKDKAVLEMPMEEFIPLYQWNLMLTHALALKKDIYTLNDEGPEIARIQQLLLRFGYLQGEPQAVYDLNTARGVETLQERFGLKRDGIVGQDTMTLITLLEKSGR